MPVSLPPIIGVVRTICPNAQPEMRPFLSVDNCSAEDTNPSDYLRAMIHREVERKRESPTSRSPLHQDRIDSYNSTTVCAIRSNDVATLRSLLDSNNVKCFDACNLNGETLLHLACRRGNLETVNFLIHEARVQVDVKDELGRTVLHDICWRAEPDTDIMACLIQVVSPQLLLVEDARGHSCFDYCRKEHWKEWIRFIDSFADQLQR
jgi:ankyrin repeat protein